MRAEKINNSNIIVSMGLISKIITMFRLSNEKVIKVVEGSHLYTSG
jgi:hypothetical protein